MWSMSTGRSRGGGRGGERCYLLLKKNAEPSGTQDMSSKHRERERQVCNSSSKTSFQITTVLWETLSYHSLNSDAAHVQGMQQHVWTNTHLIFVNVAVQELTVAAVHNGGPVTRCKNVMLPARDKRGQQDGLCAQHHLLVLCGVCV